MIKSRAYNRDNRFSKAEQDSALWTLHYCIETALKLLAPIIPFITFKLYNSLCGKDIHFEDFPKTGKTLGFKPGFSTQELCDFNSKVWQTKKESGKALNAEIETIAAPRSLKPLEKTLKSMHHAKTIVFQ